MPRLHVTVLLFAIIAGGCDSQLQRPGRDGQAADAGQLEAGVSDALGDGQRPSDQRVPDGDGALPADQQATDQGSPDRLPDQGVTPDSAVSCSGSGLAPGDHTVQLQHDGLSRSYLLHVPAGYDHSTPVPLLLTFHGLGGNPAQMATMTKLDDDSDAAGFVVAYPAGVQSSWNAGICCGQAASTGVDDVGFVRAVVADLQQQLCIDSRRIFATGMSNGGFLSHRLACEAADLIAAIAPVSSGIGVSSCTPGRPVPVIAFNGTADTLVNYTNLALTAFEGWVSRNGCSDSAPAQTYNQGDVSCETYQQCQGGVEVTLCTVEGGGHCWPGRPTCLLGAATTDISANEAMWALFQRFPQP